MQVAINAQSIEWLRDHRVFFDYTPGYQRLAPGHVLEIGDNAVVEPYTGFLWLGAGDVICTMGAWSYTWSRLHPEVKVGRYCGIAPDFTIPFPRHPMDLVSAHPFVYDRAYSALIATIEDSGLHYNTSVHNPQPPFPVIKNDVWIGRGVSILPGVTIEDGAMIATHSVVMRDVPPYAMVAGNPATVIRQRFPDETIEALLDLAWWQYRFTDFNGLTLSDPDRFIAEVRERQLQEYRPEPIPFAEMPRD
jgi:acetyltransferase-like isoleucine patch superfamily enzyme